ncbi:MAG: transcriptional regulator [Actinomycetota bacterium]|nr:transcriptional regulator [Actinomycetota bacterium]
MSLHDLDPVIHAPKRLAAMAVLAATDSVDFSFLRDHLGVSDSDLSKQMSALADAGYVKIVKTGAGRNRSTSYRMTREGRGAFDHHVATLQAIVAADAGPAGTSGAVAASSSGSGPE